MTQTATINQETFTCEKCNNTFPLADLNIITDMDGEEGDAWNLCPNCHPSDQEQPAYDHTATYSPEDNKLRLYPAYRLPTDEYNRLKAAGFSWAPRQELFVAPMWTPAREDLLIEMCGEIGDEDKSLVDRAEERAERFEDYSDRRADDATRATNAVKAIADHIPFGQPILVGHHSERKARKHAQQIENGMLRAIKMWETSEYWQQRAKGALFHAKYKERPDVRHRRIKGLEADRRKQERNKAEAEKFLKAWTAVNSLETAQHVANYDYISMCFPLDKYPRLTPDASTYEGSMSLWSAMNGVITWEQAREIALKSKPRIIAHCNRWINHYTNRIEYEKAMLNEAGGAAVDKWTHVEVGGKVLTRGEWVTILRVNKSNGIVNSVTTNRRYVSKVGIEEIKEYQPPTAEETAATKKATTALPLCNYPGMIATFNKYHQTNDEPRQTVEMSQAEWDKTHKDYKGTKVVAATATHVERVPINSQGYDPGGAYWGTGQPLYVAWEHDDTKEEYQREIFVRAADREEARAAVTATFPNATFYR